MTKPPALSFQIDVPRLKAGLKDVVGVVEARNTVPVLSNVLLVVTPTSLTITGTDLDAQVERQVPIDGADAFAITVEAGVLNRIVGKLPAESVATVALADGKVTISVGRSRFALPTLPADDFPSMILRGDDAVEFAMQAINLNGALGCVQHAISTEETRYYLNGVYLHEGGDRDLRFATTDGHRLARAILPLPDDADGLPAVIVPRKLVRLLSALLDSHQGEVLIAVSQRLLRFEVGPTTLIGKTIDGTYPDYQRVIPLDHTSRLAIDREALIAAVGRVSTVSSDKTRAVKLEFDRDICRLTVTSPEKGTGYEEVPCDWSASPLSIGFNAKFLLDTLAHLTADTVEAMMGDSAAPTLWRDNEAAKATFVVMPMRV